MRNHHREARGKGIAEGEYKNVIVKKIQTDREAPCLDLFIHRKGFLFPSVYPINMKCERGTIIEDALAIRYAVNSEISKKVKMKKTNSMQMLL